MMNNITPPPDGWPLLVALMLLAMLADKVYGRRFWKVVQVAGIVALVIVVAWGLWGEL